MESSAPRVISLTSHLLTIFLIYIFGRRWKDERSGLFAAGMLMTSLLFLIPALFHPDGQHAHFWLTLAMYASSCLLIERQPLRLGRFALLLAFALGGAVVTNSWFAVVLPPLALGLALSYTKFWAQVRRISWVKPALFFGIIAGLGIAIREHWPQGAEGFSANSALPSMSGWWFIPLVGLAFLPWSVFVPSTLGFVLTDEAIPMKRDPVKALLVLWSFTAAVFLSFIPGQLLANTHLLLPALALLCGSALSEAMDDARVPAWVQAGLLAWAALLCVLIGLLKLYLGSGIKLIPHLVALGNNGSTLAILLGVCVMILVGVWGMRRTRASITGLFAVQILLVGALVGLLSTVSFGEAGSPADPELSDLSVPKLVLPAEPPPQLRLPALIVKKDEWKGVQCGVQEPRVAVFRHADKWSDFWQKAMAPYSDRLTAVPAVDFEKEMVVGVFGGSKNTPNFEIDLKKMQVADNILIVRYKEIKKMQGVFSPPFSIQPFHMKKIPLFPGEVKFEEKL